MADSVIDTLIAAVQDSDKVGCLGRQKIATAQILAESDVALRATFEEVLADVEHNTEQKCIETQTELHRQGQQFRVNLLRRTEEAEAVSTKVKADAAHDMALAKTHYLEMTQRVEYAEAKQKEAEAKSHPPTHCRNERRQRNAERCRSLATAQDSCGRRTITGGLGQ